MKKALIIVFFFLGSNLFSFGQSVDADTSDGYAVLIFQGTKSEVQKKMKSIAKAHKAKELMMVSNVTGAYILAGSVPCGKKESKEKVLQRISRDHPDAILIKCSDLSSEKITRYWTNYR